MLPALDLLPSVRDCGLPWSKKAEAFLLWAGDDGIWANVSIVRSDSEGLGLLERGFRVSEGPDAPLPSVEAVIGLAWSALSNTGPRSGSGDVAKTSEGLLVKVNRRRKM